MDNYWEIIETEPLSAKENMDLDAELLEGLDRKDAPILHFYSWKGDCATYGHFIKPKRHLNLEAIKELNLDIAKRPTGGGIVFHAYDLAFGVLVPASHRLFSKDTLQNYALVNRVVINAITSLTGDKPELFSKHMNLQEEKSNFCMAAPTKYDVIIDGKKIGGAAQRQTKLGFLHQGTIAITAPPKEYLQKILLANRGILDAILDNSYTILNIHQLEQIEQAKNNLKNSLIQGFNQC